VQKAVGRADQAARPEAGRAGHREAARAGAGPADPADPSDRDLHSSSNQLNISTLCGIIRYVGYLQKPYWS